VSSSAPGEATDAEAPRAPPVGLLLLVTAVVGIGVSFASWGYLEVIHQVQVGASEKLPEALGYDNGAPTWWPLPMLAVAGLLTAAAITALPGDGGHRPVDGLKTGSTQPRELPGVLLAALATIALGAVLGPEAPLIALGSGLGLLAVRLLRRDAPDRLMAVVAAAGSFAAISFIFGSPVIGAVILIEAAGLDRKQLSVILPVGLLSAGLGSLVSIGLGGWSGLSTKDFAISRLSLPALQRPDVADFAWTIPVAVVIAIAVFAIFQIAKVVQPVVAARPFVLLPVAGLVVAALAIAFSQTTDQGADEVLYSGQDALSGLVGNAGGWSVAALALLLLFKGLAWSLSLGSFRGGPTFPALYLGAAAGILASHLPGAALTPAVVVGMGAAMVAVLRLPLAAVVLATVLAPTAGPGVEPLIIVGVVASFLTSQLLDRRAPAADRAPAAAAAKAAHPVVIPSGR
jgi:H+/Cl- antiporter ClcA